MQRVFDVVISFLYDMYFKTHKKVKICLILFVRAFHVYVVFKIDY